ncbi:MAG: 23S rRNA (uracil(1939)-C(5))-methyltransferase RlmD [Eubacteriales bacterium]
MNPINNNQEYTLHIEDMTHTGEGVGKVNRFTVFVDESIPLDQVKAKIVQVKKNYALGELKEIIVPSPYRIQPTCEYFEKCGGCQTQNIEYHYQLRLKEKHVLHSLQKLGGIDTNAIDFKPIIGMKIPFNYRNKAQYKLNKEGIGFYAKKSHDIIPVEKCSIQSKCSENTMAHLSRFIQEYKISIYDEKTHQGVLRGIVERVSTINHDIMLILVLNAKHFKYKKELIHFVQRNLPAVRSLNFNFNLKKTNVVLSQENQLVYGREKIQDGIGDLKYEISPLSFFQVNPIQTKVLYDQVKTYAGLTGKETVFDIYCGMGTIGLYLAKEAQRIYGIEIVPQAIKDAQANAKLNGITNTQFIAGKAEEKLPLLFKEGICADVVIVDPPRKGCDSALLQTILTMVPDRIIYVSCNPGTLARDLKVLVEGGYHIHSIQPVDMFPHTMHVETVVLMSRVEK